MEKDVFVEKLRENTDEGEQKQQRLRRALILGIGTVREATLGSSSSGNPDANSQYNWDETTDDGDFRSNTPRESI